MSRLEAAVVASMFLLAFLAIAPACTKGGEAGVITREQEHRLKVQAQHASNVIPGWKRVEGGSAPSLDPDAATGTVLWAGPFGIDIATARIDPQGGGVDVSWRRALALWAAFATTELALASYLVRQWMMT